MTSHTSSVIWKALGEDGDKVGRAAGDGVLAAADAGAGAQRRELGEIVVAAKAAKTVGIPDAAERLADLVLEVAGQL